jgi:hypothetical protein
VSTLRWLSYLIFAYTCVEGLVINIMYPATLPFIFKDFGIAAVYLVMMTSAMPPAPGLRRVLTGATAFMVVVGLMIFVPSQVALLGRLVAVKQRLFYIPLIWVGYHFLKDEADYEVFIRRLAWFSIPVSIFGIYLYFVGPVGLTSLGANYSAIVNSTSGSHGIAFWRVPATFNSPGQFGAFLLVHAALFASLLFGPADYNKHRRLLVVAMAVLLGALLVSGSRSPLIMVGLIVAIPLALTGRVGKIGVAAVAAYAAFAIAFSYFGGGVEDRVGSIASWEHVERFKESWFGQMFTQYLAEAPLGLGLGRATIGARHFADWRNIILVESYLGILAAEMGVLGVLAFGWLMWTVLAALAKARAVMARSPYYVSWLMLTFLILALTGLHPVGTTIDSAPGNLYYWFFIGVAIKFYDLERQRRMAPAVTPQFFG